MAGPSMMAYPSTAVGSLKENANPTLVSGICQANGIFYFLGGGGVG